MSHFPKLESVLLNLYQFAGLNTGKEKLATVQRRRFINREHTLEKQKEVFLNFVDELITELGLKSDDELRNDINFAISELLHASYEVENQTYTAGFSQEQVTWSCLKTFYTPWFARKVGFWNVDDAFDQGMPGGRFWFLPDHNPLDLTADLELPVSSVCRWLLDLMGEPNAYSIDKSIEYSGPKGENYDLSNLKRNLYGWLEGRTISAQKIHEYFNQDADIKFNGSFTVFAPSNLESNFEDAIAFIKKKGLTTVELSHQIPLSEESIQHILEDSPSEEVKHHFIGLVMDRWRQPSIHSIRQKLLLARIMQQAYIKLLKFLCPNVQPTCGDPTQNKVMQLVAMFKHIYNATIDSYRGATSDQDADSKFFSEINRHPFSQFCIGLNPALGDSSFNFTAQSITLDLRMHEGSKELTDVIPWDPDSLQRVYEDTAQFSELLRQTTEYKYGETLRIKQSTNRRLAIAQATNIYSLFDIYDSPAFNEEHRELAIKTANLLAETDFEKLYVMLSQLNSYLNLHRFKDIDGIENTVEELLNTAEGNPKYKYLEAPIVQYRAKHLLSQGNFESALAKFQEAFKLCEQGNYGTLNGEIARDLLALKLIMEPEKGSDHTNLFKQGLFSGMLEMGGNTIRPNPLFDITTELDDHSKKELCNYFTSDLLRPYKNHLATA